MRKPRPTPETDAVFAKQNGQLCGGANLDFARKLERERDEARDQLQAMREAIEDVNKILLSIQRNDIFEETMRNHATCALAQLQPFIKLTHTPHEQQGQQQTQHDVWLREKLKAMVKPIKEAYNPFPDKPFIL